RRRSSAAAQVCRPRRERSRQRHQEAGAVHPACRGDALVFARLESGGGFRGRIPEARKSPIKRRAGSRASPEESMSDIEIAQAAKLRRVSAVAREKLGIHEDHLEPYGHYKAKVSLNYLDTLERRNDDRL